MSISSAPPFGRGRLSTVRTDRALQYIEDNIGQPIGLQELADSAAMSRFHFSRSFKRTTGHTPIRFILIRRTEAAKLLLRNPDAQAAHIAYKCGFASASHFCTSFKAVTGMTTCQYRRTLKQMA